MVSKKKISESIKEDKDRKRLAMDVNILDQKIKDLEGFLAWTKSLHARYKEELANEN